MLAEKPKEVMEIVQGAVSLALMLTASESTTMSASKTAATESASKSFDPSKILLSQSSDP